MDRDIACNLMAVLGSRQATDIYHLLPAEGAADGMTTTTVARTLSLPPSTVARQLVALIQVGLASKERKVGWWTIADDGKTAGRALEVSRPLSEPSGDRSCRSNAA